MLQVRKGTSRSESLGTTGLCWAGTLTRVALLIGNISDIRVRQIAWTDPFTDSAFNCRRKILHTIQFRTIRLLSLNQNIAELAEDIVKWRASVTLVDESPSSLESSVFFVDWSVLDSAAKQWLRGIKIAEEMLCQEVSSLFTDSYLWTSSTVGARRCFLLCDQNNTYRR